MVQIALAIRQCLVGLLLASPELASLVGVARVEDNAKARAFGQAVRVDHGSQQGCLVRSCSAFTTLGAVQFKTGTTKISSFGMQ